MRTQFTKLFKKVVVIRFMFSVNSKLPQKQLYHRLSDSFVGLKIHAGYYYARVSPDHFFKSFHERQPLMKADSLSIDDMTLVIKNILLQELIA